MHPARLFHETDPAILRQRMIAGDICKQCWADKGAVRGRLFSDDALCRARQVGALLQEPFDDFLLAG